MKTLDVFHLLPLGLRDVFLLLPLGESPGESQRPAPLAVLPHLLAGEGWGHAGRSSPASPPLVPAGCQWGVDMAEKTTSVTYPVESLT